MSTTILTEINTIQFGFQSDQDVINCSVCVIDNPSLTTDPGCIYDSRLGCIENNSKCVTCIKDVWRCAGHFGHINLNVPIILYYKQVVQMLRLFCFKCHSLLITKDIIQMLNLKGIKRIGNYITANVSCCTREYTKNNIKTVCGEPHPEIKLETTNNEILALYKHKNDFKHDILSVEYIKIIFDNIPNEEIALLNIDYEMFHPKHLIMTKFPVIPTCCRPRMITPEHISDDDLSLLLSEIIKCNNKLFTNTTDNRLRSILKLKTAAYCDNSKGKVTHNTNHNKPMTGIKERITKKNGHVRQNLMGKRSDLTARSVLGPDPTLKLNEVAIPEEIANMLTSLEYVTPLTIDKLTRLVNTPGKASVIIKQNGDRISIKAASTIQKTHLKHGNILVRDKKQIIVTNCKMPLQQNDFILQNSISVPVVLPIRKNIKLECGDIVERFLQNGDYVLLNRQPTLHRNSMQGMKVVIKPGRTIRLNLSIVTGFNMDFDGDEGNIFVEKTIESKAELKYLSNAKYNILSAQRNKPEMVIVQDSLLGAYKMTEKTQSMTKADFMNCIMRISFDYNFFDRYKYICKLRNEPETAYTSHALFGFIFPEDFHITYPKLCIKNGVVISGFFDKDSLKDNKNSLIRLLCMEYDEKTTAAFINNIQFLTNAWLECNPFSISIEDCLIKSEDKQKQIKNTILKYFMEATELQRSTDHKFIRESRVNCSLNKAKDIGLKIAKESLHSTNGFISTVVSGSKGDFFNIAQITGLLGQQNLNEKRPGYTIDNNKRSLVHYPRNIKNNLMQKYMSRGFVVASFIEGMTPAEMFFHAMTGREGIIKTATGTAESGYVQRKIVKINEDIKIEYDGTVRDSKKNIYQFAFGGHGYDPSKVDINEKSGEVYPVNFKRLACRLNDGSEGSYLTQEKINYIIDKCIWNSNIPKNIAAYINNSHISVLQRELKTIKINPEKLERFEQFIITKYNTSRITPGECVGIIGAQCIGEKQTQTNLNTFHTAGKLQNLGVNRFKEILSVSRKLKTKTCIIYFNEKYKTPEDLRMAIKHQIVSVYFKDMYYKTPVYYRINNVTCFEFEFDIKRMFKFKINTVDIKHSLQKTLNDTFSTTNYTIGSTTLLITFNDTDLPFKEYLKILDDILITGMEGVTDIHIMYDNNEWYVVTEGSNLKQMLANPLIDNKRLYCNDFWDVYDCLGIIAVRRMLFQDLKNATANINTLHLKLLVESMTHRGVPCAITRYTMRNNNVGPLSKATFEETVEIIIAAATKTEIETNSGVSAAIISGKQPRVGTNFFDVMVDLKKLPN